MGSLALTRVRIRILFADVNRFCEGGREAVDIVAWMKKRSGPSVLQIDSIAALGEFTQRRDVYGVAYFEVANCAVR